MPTLQNIFSISAIHRTYGRPSGLLLPNTPSHYRPLCLSASTDLRHLILVLVFFKYSFQRNFV